MADQLGNVVKEGLQVLPKLHKQSFILTLCTHRQKAEGDGAETAGDRRNSVKAYMQVALCYIQYGSRKHDREETSHGGGM